MSYTLSRNQAVIVEYKEDDETDMFQVHLNDSVDKNRQLFLSCLISNEPRCEKTGLRGFRPVQTQTGLHKN